MSFLTTFFSQFALMMTVFDFCLYRDGRLVEGDRILAIDRQVLDTNISHESSIQILQAAQGHVELVVARTPHSPPAALTSTTTAQVSASPPRLPEETAPLSTSNEAVDRASNQSSTLPDSSDMVVSTTSVVIVCHQMFYGVAIAYSFKQGVCYYVLSSDMCRPTT